MAGNEDESEADSTVSDLTNIQMKDLFIKLSKATPKASGAWNYFGFLYFCQPKTKIVANFQNRTFCKLCFEKAAVQEAKSFDVKKVKNFSAKTSTSNLFSHLGTDHSISINSKSVVESTKSVQQYFNVDRSSVQQSAAIDKKFVLIRDLVLLCCKDLIPFNCVDGTGFRDFFEKYKIGPKDELPNRTSISRALSSVYDDCKTWLISYIKDNCPATIATTFDMWSCRYRRRSYITLTVHFITKDFELVDLTLSTSHFPESHKGVNVLPRVESILDSYGLSDKDTIMVTDAESNMGTTCELGSYKRLKCIGHGLHNLVIMDGFKKTEAINSLLLKVRKIVKSLRYRTSEMERLSKDEELFILEMSRLSEEFLITEDDDDDENDIDISYNENSTNTYKTLKIDVKTRWNSTIPMIESFVVNNKSVVKFLLQKAGCAELMLTTFEYNLLKELLDFLKNFQVITAIFSGSKYATLNYYVMFRQEIRSLLESEPQESFEIKELKDNMMKKFEHRFPLSDETVLASLLDPRFQNLLDVQRYLRTEGYTAVEFIQKCSQNIAKEDHRSTVKPSTDNPHAPQHGPNSSYISEMVERHSTLASIARLSSSSGETNLQRECFLLLSMGGVATVKDVLLFWKENSKIFPLLSQVAAATYCVPATSTPSERNFSTSGQCTDSKKSQITPENVDKMVFMHNNYDFIKNHCPSLIPI